MYRLTVICVNLLILVTDVVQARSYPKGMILHKAALTWEDAHRTCQRQGAVLASPTDDRMLDKMKNLMGEKNTTYFIGMKSAYYTAPFVSVEGVPLHNLTPAVMDMIDTIDQVDGDCLAMSNNSIRAVPCWSRLPFMCSNFQSLNMNYTNCGPDDEGYKYGKSHNKCYKFHGEVTTWDKAEEECVKEGGHLFVTYSYAEANTVVQILKKYGFNGHAWAGIRDYDYDRNWKSIGGQRAIDLCGANLCRGLFATNDKGFCGLIAVNVVYIHANCNTYIAPFICEKEPIY